MRRHERLFYINKTARGHQEVKYSPRAISSFVDVSEVHNIFLLGTSSSTPSAHLQGKREHQQATNETEPCVTGIRRASRGRRFRAGGSAVSSGRCGGGWCGCDAGSARGGRPWALTVPVVAMWLAADGLCGARRHAARASTGGVVGVVLVVVALVVLVVIVVVRGSAGDDDDTSCSGWSEGHGCWGSGGGDGTFAVPVCMVNDWPTRRGSSRGKGRKKKEQ